MLHNLLEVHVYVVIYTTTILLYTIGVRPIIIYKFKAWLSGHLETSKQQLGLYYTYTLCSGHELK